MKLLLGLWLQVLCALWIHCKDVTVTQLSQDDILLLKDEAYPKCFTRTEEDFTCFFETTGNSTCNFYYNIGERPREKRCDLSIQRTTEGTFLHICSFPYLDVVTYVDIHLKMVEQNTNITICSRTISVEDHILLAAPSNVSLQQNGKAGQLQVSWLSRVPKYWEDKVKYRIRYSSEGMEQMMKEGMEKWDDTVVLGPLIPGKEVQVQVAVKCANSDNAGHWSPWSDSAREMVPQSAEDVSLKCFTCDLQTVTCHWNVSKYSQPRLFYKMHLSKSTGWTDWTECLDDGMLTDQCSFQGDTSRKVLMKLSSPTVPLSRTFYSQEFTIQNIVKTSPPADLRGSLEGGRLCLTWEAPHIITLSAHMQYEVGCQIRESKSWLLVSLKGPSTSTCLEIPSRSQYKVKVRARPNGYFFSGQWSDWSNVLMGKTPAGIDTLLMTCIPVTLLITAVILISLVFIYFQKLKQWLWPPVPNLDKVLQSFLTETNLQNWDLPVTTKQYFEEACSSSLVEVMSQQEVSALGKSFHESTQLLSSEPEHGSGDQGDESPRTELKMFPDYVTLNRESVIMCAAGNKYVCEQFGEIRGLGMEGEFLPKTGRCFCIEDSVYVPNSLDTDLLNHSYLPLSEPAVAEKESDIREPGNLYTNLPCSNKF
ncbi:thrombopoietin receptor isoform X1 [Nerophis ophidion]|uniref:thrombopoietin receptor isoform X1 n=1 Tax=Nerophis ophidion TaxID=159077 RepID=UPI002AE00BE6|nr:thrombopoietin receptor isoform X1 [Nerophis ophidion]